MCIISLSLLIISSLRLVASNLTALNQMAANVGVLPVASIQIDYANELEKITDFLSRYVPPPRTRARGLPADDDEEAEDEEAEDEEDILADELEGMDVAADPGRSKAKYMKTLRRVANRRTAEVVVDLADLQKVSVMMEIVDGHSAEGVWGLVLQRHVLTP